MSAAGTMRPGLRRIVLLCAVLLIGACHGPVRPDPRRMSFPAPTLSPPAHTRVTAANGTVLYLLPDGEVPLVEVSILVRTGSVLEPVEKTGLAELAGQVLRSGGTSRYSGDDLSEALESMGAVLETSIGWQSGRASLSVLKEDTDRGVMLLAEVLRRPLFEEAEVERAKNRKIERIRRSNDDPDTIAFRELRSALYGDDPRGRRPSPAIVASLTREDLVDFHRRYFFPDGLIVGVSGDFEESEFLEIWERHFGDWEDSGKSAVPFPIPESSPPRTLTLVSKDFPQATMLSGHLAPPLESPDYFPFYVLNYILGGAGFNSRLTEQVRSNRGLAYTVGSWYRADAGYGVLVVHCKSGLDSAAEALALMAGIIEEAQREGVTEKELSWAKESIINNLIFSVDSTAEILSRRMSHEYHGLPPDYLERYPERIGAVTRRDILRVADRFLSPRQASTVIVGDGSRLKGRFGEFGSIREVPLPEF